MQVFDDGRAAIGVDVDTGKFRVLTGVPTEDTAHPPFTTVGSWMKVSDDVLKVYGFGGPGLGRRHMRLMVQWALAQGFRLAYIDRIEGHVMPGAVLIEEGDFKGWWRLDLVQTRLLGRKQLL